MSGFLVVFHGLRDVFGIASLVATDMRLFGALGGVTGLFCMAWFELVEIEKSVVDESL
jgi:hypothetical protein